MILNACAIDVIRKPLLPGLACPLRWPSSISRYFRFHFFFEDTSPSHSNSLSAKSPWSATQRESCDMNLCETGSRPQRVQWTECYRFLQSLWLHRRVRLWIYPVGITHIMHNAHGRGPLHELAARADFKSNFDSKSRNKTFDTHWGHMALQWQMNLFFGWKQKVSIFYFFR